MDFGHFCSNVSSVYDSNGRVSLPGTWHWGPVLQTLLELPSGLSPWARQPLRSSTVEVLGVLTAEILPL